MLVQLHQSSLWTALQHIARAIAPRPVIPLMSGIYVQADDEGLTLTASNLSMLLRYRIGSELAAIVRHGRMVIPARNWIEIVRHTDPGATITLELLDNGRMRMNAGRAEYHWNGMDPEEYPRMESKALDPAIRLQLPNNQLRSIVRQVAFAAASTEARPILTGILCQLADGRFSMTSTDGVRMATRYMHGQSHVINGEPLATTAARTVDSMLNANARDPHDAVQIVIPAKHLIDYVKAPAVEQGTTLLTLNEHHVMLETNGFTMQSVVLEGAYPSVDKVISTADACTTALTVNTRGLLQALERSALMSGGGSVVRIHAGSEGVMTLSAQHAEIGDVQEDVEVSSIQGQPIGISCNASYMADLIGAVDSEQVLLRMSGRHSPIIVSPAGSSSALYALTPIRTRES